MNYTGWPPALEEIHKLEGLESTNIHDTIEMYAWECGYQGIKLSKWFIDLGKEHFVDVKKEYEKGKQAKEEG